MKRVDEYEVLVSECGEWIYNDADSKWFGHQYKPYSTNGYKQFKKMINGKRRSLLVHRLVAMAYIPNPDNHPDVNHKDGNKGNNHVSNLEWVSHSDNIFHAMRTGLMKQTGRPLKKNRTING